MGASEGVAQVDGVARGFTCPSAEPKVSVDVGSGLEVLSPSAVAELSVDAAALSVAAVVADESWDALSFEPQPVRTTDPSTANRASDLTG